MTAPEDTAIAAQIKRSKDTLDLLEAAKTERSAANDALEETLKAISARASEQQRADLARDLYWNHPEVDENAITHGLGFPNVWDMVKATNHQPTVQCPRCQRHISLERRGDKGVAPFMDYPDRVCVACREALLKKLMQQHDRENQAEWQRWKDAQG